MNEEKNPEKRSVTEEELKSIAGGAEGWCGLYDGPWKTVCNLLTTEILFRSAETGRITAISGYTLPGCTAADGSTLILSAEHKEAYARPDIRGCPAFLL